MSAFRRIDTAEVKRRRPIVDVVASYGIDLHSRGRTVVGRCPFHADGGRPNLHVYPSTDSFFCFRCGVGGDTITFVERIEGIAFREAVDRLTGNDLLGATSRLTPVRMRRRRPQLAPWGPDEWACLAASVELYHNRLLTDERALAYTARRGVEPETLKRCRVGYAAGDELASYLRWRRVPIQSARRTGLLRSSGDELMAGRIVIPEIRAGRPIWLIGRGIEAGAGPKYLGQPGPRRLLGWDAASRERSICVVEGAFDWLTLQQWRVPSVALLGTHVQPATIHALRRFHQVHLVLDTDPAGLEATGRLLQALGPVAVQVSLDGVKDVADLATHPDGVARFSRAIREAAQASAA